MIALAAVILAAIVVLIWVFGAGHGDEDDEDQVTASASILARAPNGDVIVTLARDQQARIGLKTETLASVTRARDVTAYGVILDPAPLASLDAQLASARAALDASEAEYARAKLLHSEQQNVSLKDFQIVQAKFQSDQAQVNLLNQRLADQWGVAVGSMAPAARARLIDALIGRDEAIIRVSAPPGQAHGGMAARARVIVLGDEAHPLTADSIWAAPSVDPSFQGQGFMLGVKAHGFALRSGAAVTASLEFSATADRGVVVPNAAIVRTGNASWAYVQTAPTRFERRAIAEGEEGEPVSDGWFVTGDFAAGDRVVVTGAQALLSEEFKSQIQVED